VNTKPNALPWLWLSLVVLVLDLATKYLALATLDYATPVPVIDGFFYWTLVYNEGAAFSFLAGASGWQRWFFSAVAVGITALLVHWLRGTARGDWRTALPFALVIGGALGNLYDRLRWGHVVDFVDLHFGSYSYPAFNLADSAIVLGAIGIVVFGFRAQKQG